MAYVYLPTGNTGKALEHATAEYNRRPKNIDVNELMALVYYKKKDYVNARKYIKDAFVTGSKNPGLLGIAGLIYLRSGELADGKNLITEGLVNNQVMNEEMKKDCLQSLVDL